MGELMRRKWDNVEANVSLEKSVPFRDPVRTKLAREKDQLFSRRFLGGLTETLTPRKAFY